MDKSGLLSNEGGNKVTTDLRVTSHGRSCTNVLWFLFFVLCWIGFIASFIVAVTKGDFNAIWYGSDYNGQQCNSGSLGKYIYYPRMTQDIIAYIGKVDAEVADFNDIGISDIQNMPIFGICVNECPQNGSVVCTSEYLDAHNDTLPTYGDVTQCYKIAYHDENQEMCNHCWGVPLNTTSVLHRCLQIKYENPVEIAKCVYPSTELNATDVNCIVSNVVTNNGVTYLAHKSPLLDQLVYWKTKLSGFVSDIVLVYYWIALFGLILPLLLGYIFVLFTKCTISFLIYLLMILLILLSIVFTIFCFFQAGYFNFSDISDKFSQINNFIPSDLTPTESNLVYWKIGAWAMIVADIIIIAVMVLAWKSVNSVVKTVKESTNLIFRQPLLLFLIFSYVIKAALILLFFSFTSALLFSISVTKDVNIASEIYYDTCRKFTNSSCAIPESFKFTETSTAGYVLIVFNIIGLIWNFNFLRAIFVMIVAGTVGQYYYTPRNPNTDASLIDLPSISKEQKENAVCNAMGRTYRYHLGSCAFGSFVITFLCIINCILKYIHNQVKNSNSMILKLISCCCMCCFWWFNCCLKYLTQSGYILVSIRGYGFYSACKEAFSLIESSKIFYVTSLFVLNAVEFIGKLVIAITCTFISYFVFVPNTTFKYGGKSELSNPIGPVVVTFLVSYVIGSLFMSIYSLISNSFIICLLEDETSQKASGLQSSLYTPPDLRGVFDSSNDDTKK